MNNIAMFYVRWFKRILYMYYSIIVIEFISNEFIIKTTIINYTYISNIIIELK